MTRARAVTGLRTMSARPECVAQFRLFADGIAPWLVRSNASADKRLQLEPMEVEERGRSREQIYRD